MGVKLPVWDAILLQEFSKQSVGTTCITYPPVASHINHLRNLSMDTELSFKTKGFSPFSVHVGNIVVLTKNI